jgi:hypothetical protein
MTQPNSTEIIRGRLEKAGGFIEHCVDSFLYEFLLNNHLHTGGERKTDSEIVEFINSYAPTDDYGVTVGWEIDGENVVITVAGLKNIRRELAMDVPGSRGLSEVNKKLLDDFKELYSGDLGDQPAKDYTPTGASGGQTQVGWHGQHDTYYMTRPVPFAQIFKNVGPGLHGPDNGPADFNAWDLQIAIALIANTGLVGSNVPNFLGTTSKKYVEVCSDDRSPRKDQWIPLERIGAKAYTVREYAQAEYGDDALDVIGTQDHVKYYYVAMQQDNMSLTGDWSQNIPNREHWPHVEAQYAKFADDGTCKRSINLPEIGDYKTPGAVYTDAKSYNDYMKAAREHNSRFVARVARNYQEEIAKRLAELLAPNKGLLKDVKREAEGIAFFRQPTKERRTRAALEEVEYNEIQKKLAKYKKKLKPVDHQCYLLENIKRITNFQEELVTSRGTPYKYILASRANQEILYLILIMEIKTPLLIDIYKFAPMYMLF